MNALGQVAGRVLTFLYINTSQLELSQQHKREPLAPKKKADACVRPSHKQPGTLGACMPSPKAVIMTP